MKALVFLHNAFLCLVDLISRCTAAKNLPPVCDLQKGQRPLDPPKAASTSLVRAQQPPSHVAQGFLHSFFSTSPGSSIKPGQTLSPYGFVAGGRPVLACQRIQVWVCPESSTEEGQETHLSVTTSSGRSPTCLQAVHKERSKGKKTATLSLPLRCFSQSLPLLLVAVAKMSPSKLWVQ